MNEFTNEMAVFGKIVPRAQIAACEDRMRTGSAFTSADIVAIARNAGATHAQMLVTRLIAKNKRLGRIRRRPSSFLWDWVGVGKTVSVYLAGPDVFRPDQAKLFDERKSLLVKNGFVPLCPMDNDIPADAIGRERDKAIYHGNLRMVRDCDLVLANVNSFRGPGIDDGTSFEIGAAVILGKAIIGYRDNLMPMHERFGMHDEEGCAFETFGNSINLMPDNGISESGGALICGNFTVAVAEAVRWRAGRVPGGPTSIHS